jgi:hypothetical protein
VRTRELKYCAPDSSTNLSSAQAYVFPQKHGERRSDKQNRENA